jgi:hypothetical protein
LDLRLDLLLNKLAVAGLYLTDLDTVDLNAAVIRLLNELAVLVLLDIDLEKLPHLDIDIYLSRIGEVPQPCLVRVDRLVALIGLLDAGEGVHADLVEADLVPYVLLGLGAYVH